MTDAYSMASFGSSAQVRHGTTCQRLSVPARLATIASCAGGRLADRGYDADWIRELARQQGAWANIPPKRNRKDPICFNPYLYRARNLIERFFNKIKQCRRVATRYDKLAANYLAFVKLASIRIWLRANESTTYNNSRHFWHEHRDSKITGLVLASGQISNKTHKSGIWPR
jgi:transposase